MSFVSGTTTDPGSLNNEAVHEGTSSRASAASTSSSSGQDGELGGEGSESESYVEVEQLGDDGAAGPPGFAPPNVVSSPAPSPPCSNNVVRHVTKRTLITLHQRSVLEEYYRNGMTSASQQLSEVHEVVAAKTGLDVAVVRVSRDDFQCIVVVCFVAFDAAHSNARMLSFASRAMRK